MANAPRYTDDPGTYLAQAWSLQYEQTLAPYAYFYDHPPAGWIQMALWSALTNGFGRHETAIGFGNECMLIAGIVSAALVFMLARRAGLTRWAAATALLLFGLSPLAVQYGRWTYLDNLATPWLLASVVLAMSPRRSIGAAIGSGLCLGVAGLTKETALAFLPVVAWALWQHSDPRNRRLVVTIGTAACLLTLGLYPMYALLKGELVPGPGHTSLLGTVWWQLVERTSTGSVLDADSAVRQLLGAWMSTDQVLLLGALVSAAVCVTRRSLRPVILAVVIGWVLIVRGGYVPYMQVIFLLPWSAVLIAGAGELLVARVRRRPARWGVAVAATVLLVATTTAAAWHAKLGALMFTETPPVMRQAEVWAADNIPRDNVVVVHDSIWVDLVAKYGFKPRPILASKLDPDPAVAATLTRIDYLIVPNWYYIVDRAGTAYPTLLEAKKHAVAVAEFGSGDDGVTVYRVSRFWSPR